jgi:hypothetical protein
LDLKTLFHSQIQSKNLPLQLEEVRYFLPEATRCEESELSRQKIHGANRIEWIICFHATCSDHTEEVGNEEHVYSTMMDTRIGFLLRIHTSGEI